MNSTLSTFNRTTVSRKIQDPFNLQWKTTTCYTMMFLKFYEFVKTDLLFAIFVKKACIISTWGGGIIFLANTLTIFAVVSYY